MIGVFIPSYNRAMQLHALLESINLHDKNKLLSNIHVRYQGTTTEYQHGYIKLKNNENFRHIDFKNKSSLGLGEDMLETMENQKYEYFCVITDDCIFYRDFDLKYDEFHNLMIDEINHFTLRCGKNTTSGDYTRPHIKCEVKAEDITSSVMKWKWTTHNDCFGYPNALDGTIFNRNHILYTTLSSVQRIFDYRKWECLVHEHMQRNPIKQYALSFHESILVNSPTNMVADGPYCKNGLYFPWSIDQLNKFYLLGQKIDLNSIESNSIISVQQELPFKFIKNEDI